MSKNDPPPKQLSLILILALGVLFFPTQVDKAAGTQPETQNCYLRPYAPIKLIKDTTLASIGQDDLFSDLTYGTLIRCLAYWESGFNQNAIGDHGAAIGILQFHQPTFDAYCSGSIYSAEDQIACCDEMLKSDFNNIGHWTTAGFCLTN